VKFGPVPLDQAAGAVLAHSVRLAKGRLRKGAVLGADDLLALAEAGHSEVVAARLDPDDLSENEAAARLAAALVPDPQAAHLRISNAFTGRVNLIATGPGVVEIDAAAISAVNRIHPMITVATVPEWQQVGVGQMVATIKIISYAVNKGALAQAETAGRAALRLHPPALASAGLVVTQIPGGPDDTKGIAAIEGRLKLLGLSLAQVQTVPHAIPQLAQALDTLDGDLALILTASATSDIDDVAPMAVRRAGGTIARFGMPVDPGNLLFVGDIGARPVIGLPGCARSPALNGADWVLARVACGIQVSDADIASMGVGGLLKEIPTRPQPRAGAR